MIQGCLGLPTVGVLMGANVAADVSKKEFVESTLAFEDISVAESLRGLFHCASFHVETSTDVKG